MSDGSVYPEIKEPGGWRGWLPWERRREAKKLRARIWALEEGRKSGATEYRRVCGDLEDAVFRAEVAEGKVEEVFRLLSQWADPRLVKQLAEAVGEPARGGPTA